MVEHLPAEAIRGAWAVLVGSQEMYSMLTFLDLCGLRNVRMHEVPAIGLEGYFMVFTEAGIVGTEERN